LKKLPEGLLLGFLTVAGYYLILRLSLGVPTLFLVLIIAIALLMKLLHVKDLAISRNGILREASGWFLGTLGVFILGLALQSTLFLFDEYRLMAEDLSRRFARMDRVILLFSVLVAAPLSEEIVFRRFLLGRLKTKTSLPVTVLITSLAFSLAHHPAAMPYALVSGVWLATIALRQEALIWPIATHLLLNLFSLVFQPETWFSLSFFPFMTAVSLVLGAIFLILGWKILIPNQKLIKMV